MDLKETTVNKNYVFKGHIINVRSDDALRGDGTPCTREIVEHPGGAAVLYVENDKVLMVKQYRYAYGESIYEIPAGKLDPNELPQIAASRELEEETGIKSENLELMFTLYPTPGYTNEKIYIYHAKDGVRTHTHPDEGEFLDIQFIPLKEVERKIKEGEIRDAKTIVAVQSYLLKQK